MSELPEGYSFLQDSFYFRGEGENGEYVRDVRTPQGNILMAVSSMGKYATQGAIEKAWDHHAFWTKPDLERLKIHLENGETRGRLYDTELIDVLKTLSKKLLQE